MPVPEALIDKAPWEKAERWSEADWEAFNEELAAYGDLWTKNRAVIDWIFHEGLTASHLDHRYVAVSIVEDPELELSQLQMNGLRLRAYEKREELTFRFRCTAVLWHRGERFTKLKEVIALATESDDVTLATAAKKIIAT